MDYFVAQIGCLVVGSLSCTVVMFIMIRSRKVELNMVCLAAFSMIIAGAPLWHRFSIKLSKDGMDVELERGMEWDAQASGEPRRDCDGNQRTVRTQDEEGNLIESLTYDCCHRLISMMTPTTAPAEDVLTGGTYYYDDGSAEFSVSP